MPVLSTHEKTHQDIDVVACDNARNDSTVAIIKGIMVADSRIRLLENNKISS